MSITYAESSRPMPLMQLPVRSAVIDVGDDRRVLWSPASTFDDDALRALGPVTDIVAPNLWHTDGVVAAARVFADATLWGPPGIVEHQPSVSWRVLGRDPWPYEATLAHLTIDGMPEMMESVFIERATQTLFVADFAFNVVDASGLGARLILSMFGTWRRFGVSRLYVRGVKDRAAFEASLARLHSEDFAIIAPAHGALVVDAKAKLFAALHERGYALSLA